jgi:hypothetical protein
LLVLTRTATYARVTVRSAQADDPLRDTEESPGKL